MSNSNKKHFGRINMTNSSLSSDTTGCLVTIKLQAHVYPNVEVFIIHEKPLFRFSNSL